MNDDKYTLEAGRNIYCHGQPCISINREGSTHPAAADDLAHIVTSLLNIFDSAMRAYAAPVKLEELRDQANVQKVLGYTRRDVNPSGRAPFGWHL